MMTAFKNKMNAGKRLGIPTAIKAPKLDTFIASTIPVKRYVVKATQGLTQDSKTMIGSIYAVEIVGQLL